jgi:Tol biopolymer transport system component
VKRITLLIMGVLLVAGGLEAKPSLASLEEKVARNQNNARALYQLARLYCEEDSSIQAIETWKRLASLDLDLASDVFLRAKVAVYLGLEPFFPQRLSDSIVMVPRFSSDGRWITFYRSKDWSIGTMDISGENFRWLTGGDDEIPTRTPCFAGSRDRLIFIRTSEDRSGDELVYFNAEGGETEEVVFKLSSFLERTDWVSDELPVVFGYISQVTKSMEIGLYDRKAGEFVELTSNVCADRFPRYSSDGKLIAYASNDRLQLDIYIMNTKGKVVERVTMWQGTDLLPDFGARDRKIAFCSDRHGGRQNDIFICDRRTGEVIPITNNEQDDSSPDLSDDGNWLLFQSNRGDGRPRAYIVPLNQPITTERLIEEIQTQGK